MCSCVCVCVCVCVCRTWQVRVYRDTNTNPLVTVVYRIAFQWPVMDYPPLVVDDRLLAGNNLTM